MKLTYPNLDKLLPHQIQVMLNDRTRFKTLVWHRRARKTTTALTEITRQALLHKGIYWYVMPTYRMAKDSVWRDPNMLFDIIPQELIERKNEADMIMWLKNGSTIQLKGSDNPDTLRGAGPQGFVLDEFDDMKMDVWPILEPILRANNGWAWFIGTPKGKLKLFEHYQKGLLGHPEWKSWLLKASTSQIISQGQLNEMKLSMTQSLFNQEMECEFLEGEGSVFRQVRDVMTSVPEDPIGGELYVMGVDLAKVTDYTVITVYKRSNNKQVYQNRIQKLDYTYQKAFIKDVARKYNNALVMIDATGLGDPIADDLTRQGVAIEPFKITEQSKKDLIDKLSIWIQQRNFQMLNLDETSFEFDNFSYEIGPTGKIRYGARVGFHDDIVIAHALAVWSLQPLLIKKVEPDYGLVYRDIYEKTKGQDTDDLFEYEMV